MRKVVVESSSSEMKCIVPILILFFLSYSLAAQAPMRLTAESSVAFAIKGNKDLVAARFLVQDAEGRAGEQVGCQIPSWRRRSRLDGILRGV